jgi:hypothetical protein
VFKMPMLKTIACAWALAGLAGLGACSEGSSENAGEKMDSAIEQATQGHENKGDGALEKAGEQVDKVTGAENKDAVDAIGDATDGDKDTKAN